MDNKYVVGDVVTLNAGGPDMSVLQVNKPDQYTTNKHYQYRCQWFAGKKLEAGVFSEQSLVKVIPKVDSNEG